METKTHCYLDYWCCFREVTGLRHKDISWETRVSDFSQNHLSNLDTGFSIDEKAS